MKYKREYAAWYNMRHRCLNSKSKYYHRYGGRGIKVCDRWLNSFYNFLEDMGKCPDGLTLDRFPNNNGDYGPGNCRWATTEQQNLNKENTVLLEINGEIRPLIEWCEIYNISEKTYRSRIRNGKSILEALYEPININNKFSEGHKRMYNKKYLKYEMDGVSKTLFEWCSQYNLPYDRIYWRVTHGMDIKTALTKKLHKHYLTIIN